jgi:hypothetical protein
MIKSRKIKRAGHVAYKGRGGMCMGFYRDPKGKRPLGRLRRR